MAQAIASENNQSSIKHRGPGSVIPAITLLAVALLAFFSFYQITPPDALPSDAPLTEFSAGRAMKYIEAIARKPHPIGSPEHTEVRNYIISELTAMGLSPEVQKSSALRQGWGPHLLGATVENILVRLKGTGSGKAVLFVGHYDSVATGPGASDNASAVATMLETLRALQTGPPLRNDLIFLFSDAEEVGLLGAKAFVDEAPASKEVMLVINFEARGSGGASIMFETSSNNRRLIAEFARSAPYIVANSLTYEIYKLLPNDTDLTVFKEAGFQGLNFAYVRGSHHYHTQLDDVENVSRPSLQHHGYYALGLARHFGNTDMEQTAEGDAVYFNVFKSILIHYPAAWVIPVAILVAVLFVATVALGFRARQLTAVGVVLGFFTFFLSLIVSALAVTLIWWIIERLHPRYDLIFQGDVYNSLYYFVSFAALTVAVSTALYTWFNKKRSVHDLSVGALFWWLIIMIATAVLLPGASYLFVWPLLFSLAALCFSFVSKQQNTHSLKHLLTLLICAIPGIFLLTPIIYLLFISLSLDMSAVFAIMLALLLGLLIPHLALITAPRKWLLPVGALLISLIFILLGSFTSGFDDNRRQPNSVFYAMNADSGEAVWASFDPRPDEWTSQFFDGSREKGSMRDYLPSTRNDFMKDQAAPLPLSAPNVTLLAEDATASARTLRLHISSVRQGPIIMLTTDPEVEVLACIIKGKRIANDSRRPWGLRYYALPQEGIELTLEVKPSSNVKIRATDLSYGISEDPAKPLRPRPDYMMPSILSYSDMTIVSKSFTF